MGLDVDGMGDKPGKILLRELIFVDFLGHEKMQREASDE
jgi:hypothetical protein